MTVESSTVLGHRQQSCVIQYGLHVRITDLYKYSPDAVPPIPAVSYHVATDKLPAQNGDKFRSILATIYNQSQLAERKHVARYWSINTVATAVPLSAHPSPLVITTKLAAAILGGRLFGGGVLPAQYCPCVTDHQRIGYYNDLITFCERLVNSSQTKQECDDVLFCQYDIVG